MKNAYISTVSYVMEKKKQHSDNNISKPEISNHTIRAFAFTKHHSCFIVPIVSKDKAMKQLVYNSFTTLLVN